MKNMCKKTKFSATFDLDADFVVGEGLRHTNWRQLQWYNPLEGMGCPLRAKMTVLRVEGAIDPTQRRKL